LPKQPVRHPDRRVSTGAYNDGVVVGPWLYVSGCGPRDLRTNEIVGTTVEAQTEATLGRVKATLEAAGFGMEHMVKCTVYLKRIDDFERFNGVYAKAFPDPKPARTTVQAGLRSGVLVQVDAIAYIM
jgi:2-iminobutanoate/2-iminopropanoate deaminase